MTITLAFVLSTIALAVAVGGIQLATTGETDLGVGYDDRLCGTVTDGLLDDGSAGRPVVEGLGPGATERPAAVEVCATDPSPVVAAIAITRTVGAFALLVGIPFLLRRLVVTAQVRGLFSATTATAVRRFGWVLVVVAVAGPVLAVLGESIVLSELVEGRAWWDGLGGLDPSWSLLVTALGTITVGRVLAHAVVLQEDADATI